MQKMSGTLQKQTVFTLENNKLQRNQSVLYINGCFMKYQNSPGNNSVSAENYYCNFYQKQKPKPQTKKTSLSSTLESISEQKGRECIRRSPACQERKCWFLKLVILSLLDMGALRFGGNGKFIWFCHMLLK